MFKLLNDILFWNVFQSFIIIFSKFHDASMRKGGGRESNLLEKGYQKKSESYLLQKWHNCSLF